MIPADPDKEPLKCLVMIYKATKGVPYDDISWNRVHWGRASKAGKDLLEICGSLRMADACMVEIAKKFEEKELSWTLETIVKHAHDWIAKKRGPINVSAHAQRTRFFAAMSERKRSGSGLGLSQENGPILDALRSIEVAAKTDHEDNP